MAGENVLIRSRGRLAHVPVRELALGDAVADEHQEVALEIRDSGRSFQDVSLARILKHVAGISLSEGRD